MNRRSVRALLLFAVWLGWNASEALALSGVLCVGDSITMGYGVSVPYPTRLANMTGRSVVNEGLGGEGAHHGLRRVDGLLNRNRPSTVLIMYGTNDVNSKANLRDCAMDVIEIALRARAFGAIPVIATVPPMFGGRAFRMPRVVEFNHYLRAFAAEYNIPVAEVQNAFGSNPGLMISDGYHPNDDGAEVIARTFAAQIAILLSSYAQHFPDTRTRRASFSVNASVPWTASANHAWITITSGHSGSGDRTVKFDVAANTGAARTGTITVAGNGIRHTLVIRQDAATLELKPGSTSRSAAGVVNRQLQVIAHLPWTATANNGWITIVSGHNGTGNGIVTYTVAPNPGPARNGTITVSVGGTRRTFRVNQWPAATHPGVSADGDFDGDGRADLAVYKRRTGDWTLQLSSGAQWRHKFGSWKMLPVPADYDGDGLLDFAAYERATGTWNILYSSSGRSSALQLGGRSAIPVPGDYDGDGQADLAVFHQTKGRWYFRCSTAGAYSAQFGFSGWVPVPADYDGDGRTDLAVYHPANGMWHVLRSSTGQVWQKRFGSRRNLPVPADYDGDGKADLAVYHHVDGNWRIRKSTTATLLKQHLGWSSTIPVPADYDGDGATDMAVYHASSHKWYIDQSTTGTIVRKTLGGSVHTPVLAWPMIHNWLKLR